MTEIRHALEVKHYQPDEVQELLCKLQVDVHNIKEELADYINSSSFNFELTCSYDDDDEDEESSIELPPFVAITPALLTEKTVDSLQMGDEHLDTVPKTESDVLIKSSVEIFVPIPSEPKGISDNMCDVPSSTTLEVSKDHSEILVDPNDDTSSDDDSFSSENIEYVDAPPLDSELVSLEVVENVVYGDGEIEDDVLRDTLSNVNLLIAKILALKDNPLPSPDSETKSSSTSLNSLLEETDFDNSLPEYENFFFNLEENSSGSPTSLSDLSLPNYEAFYFPTQPTLQSELIPVEDDDSFLETLPMLENFKFVIEENNSGSTTIHVDLSLPEFECFHFKIEPDTGDLFLIDTSRIREIFFTYVVWIFLPFLTNLVIPPYLHSAGSEDKIFDPGIVINRFYSFMPGISHRSGTFIKFNTYRSHLNESPMEMLSSTLLPHD